MRQKSFQIYIQEYTETHIVSTEGNRNFRSSEDDVIARFVDYTVLVPRS